MPDHHSIMQEVINSKTVLKQMGQPAAALSGKIDAISVEMQKALQLRDGYKKAQATLATLKKAADDQSKKSMTPRQRTIRFMRSIWMLPRTSKNGRRRFRRTAV